MPSQNRHSWIILVMFMAAHAVNDGFLWVIPPLLPALREHFHLSYTEMGALYTLYRFLGDTLQAPTAYLVHFAPTSAILSGGLLWSSVGMVLASLSPSYGVLAWMFTISGIGRATYHPLAATLLSRVFGRDSLGRAIAFHMSGSSIGHILAPLLVGVLLTFGWRLPIQVWSILGLLTGVSLFFFLKNHKNLYTEKKVLIFPFFSRPLGIYLLALSVWGIAQTGLMTFLPLFLVDNRGFTAGKSATLYGIMSLSGAICRPFIGALMDWMGRRKPVIIGGFIISALSILGIASIKTQWIMYLCIVLLGTFGSGHSGLSDTFMIEMIPSYRREETIGFILTVRMSLGALAPLIVGLCSERISMHYVFMILSAVPILTALLISLAEEKPME